jgi:hypothetical protein
MLDFPQNRPLFPSGGCLARETHCLRPHIEKTARHSLIGEDRSHTRDKRRETIDRRQDKATIDKETMDKETREGATGDKRQETGRQETRDRETRDRRQETRDKRQETRDKRQETRDRRQQK